MAGQERPEDEWRQAGVPEEIGHVSKLRLALGLLDRPAEQGWQCR
ncbi:hypothetical protein [Streptomyces sp. ok210]|jgi:hypothetical protein|nr:hypothetical protein [Streptomyces sp. ok210]